MKKRDDIQTLETELVLLKEKARDKKLSVEEILDILSDKAPALILLLLSLPFCQPIQIPGFSTPFGIAIAGLGVRMMWGKKLWLPKRLLDKEVSQHVIEQISDKGLYLIEKIRRWIHPRVEWMCHSAPFQIINAFTVFFLGLFLALPLPIPLTNLLSAWSIFLISIGIIENDGVFVMMGYLISLITLSFFLGIFLSLNHYFALAAGG